MAKSREMAQSAKVSPVEGYAAWQTLTKALFDDYRPELHYMRGPGPASARATPIVRYQPIRIEMCGVLTYPYPPNPPQTHHG